MAPPSLCRSCGAAVRWVKSAKTGRVMPLDPEPRDDGNIVLLDRWQLNLRLARVLEHDEVTQERLFGIEPRYVSHFATCPQADEWRRD